MKLIEFPEHDLTSLFCEESLPLPLGGFYGGRLLPNTSVHWGVETSGKKGHTRMNEYIKFIDYDLAKNLIEKYKDSNQSEEFINQIRPFFDNQ
jgi:hypothetical protein